MCLYTYNTNAYTHTCCFHTVMRIHLNTRIHYLLTNTHTYNQALCTFVCKVTFPDAVLVIHRTDIVSVHLSLLTFSSWVSTMQLLSSSRARPRWRLRLSRRGSGFLETSQKWDIVRFSVFAPRLQFWELSNCTLVLSAAFFCLLFSSFCCFCLVAEASGKQPVNPVRF